MVDLSDYKPKIFAEINKDKLSTFELEVRFKGITKFNFFRVLRTMEGKISFQRNETIDYTENNIRITHSEGKLLKTKKTQALQPKDIDEYNIRIALSKEENLGYTNQIPQYPSETRKKNRWSFILANDIARLDMTEVATKKSSEGDFKVGYEIECEMLTEINEPNMDVFVLRCNEILQLIQDTNVIYTKSMRNIVINDYNNILDAPHSNRYRDGEPILSHRVLAQPRNLKRPDCVHGGLIGGKITYSLTHKASGLRKLLFIHETGIWLVFPPLSLNLVISNKNVIFGNIDKLYHKTITDGENIPLNMRTQWSTSVANLYFPFDLMALSGNRHIQQDDHFERLKNIEKLYNMISTPLLTLAHKVFRPIITIDDLHTVITQLKAEQEAKTLAYKTDGFIITPINSPYVLPPLKVPIEKYEKCQSVYDLPLHERRLTKWPEMCKIKPWKELTADVLLADQKLYTRKQRSCGDTKSEQKDIEFIGSRLYTFSLEFNVLWNTIPSNIPNGTIIELGPAGELKDFENEERVDANVKLEMRGIRGDKTAPNTDENVKSIWDDINQPLTEDTLLGKDFNLMFQYHSFEKTKLLNKLPAKINILDIGSGRGGTLGKMKRFNHIVCVEPDIKNYTELDRRANISFNGKKMADKITLLKTGGENYQYIIEQTSKALDWHLEGAKIPLCITLFLSLSFFFSPDNKLALLAQTIRGVAQKYWESGGTNNVTVIFTTIEKHRLLSVASSKTGIDMEQLINYGAVVNPVPFKIGDADLVISAPAVLYINIPNSIVKDQNEFLVDLDKFAAELGLQDIKIETHNKEKFLSSPEMELSSCYVSGTSRLLKAGNFGVVVSPPPYIKSFGKTFEGGLFVESADGRGDYFTAVGYPSGTPGYELRNYYASWLRLIDPEYPTGQDAINRLYGGVDPRQGLYKDILPANINYYTTHHGNYHRFLSRLKGELKGFDYIIKHIQDHSTLLPHTILLPLAYCIKRTINILKGPDLENTKIEVPGVNSQIIILDNGSSKFDGYSPMGVWRRDTGIIFLFT